MNISKKSIVIQYPTSKQKIAVENNFDNLESSFNWSNYSKKILIADPVALKNCDFDFTAIVDEIILLDAGEKSKSLETAQKLVEILASKKISRSGVLVGLGGGVIGDLVGFVASIYMRGIDYVFLPSTLMSQTDTTIQKVGISIGNLKNICGSFYSPKLTYINTDLLKSLPNYLIKEGLVESIKHSFLDDLDHVRLLESSFELSNFEDWNWSEIIYRSLKIKANYIEKDLQDTLGFHKSVSWGHTFANAFEGMLEVSHGRAVLTGMHLSNYISNKRGLLSDELFARITNLLNKINLEVVKIDNPERVIEFLRKDKLSSKGEINIVILEDIGKFSILRDLLPEDILEAIKYLKTLK